ncbi:nitrate/nitrite transporter [Chloroflexota bacterium]
MKTKFSYSFIVVAVAFVILVVAVGGTSSFGVFFRPFVIEFGLTRVMTLSAVSLGIILVGFLSLGVGKLSDRLGPRLVLTASGLLLGLGYLVMSQISVIWQQYLFYGMIMGVGLASVIIPSLSTIARWFDDRRSTMTGIVMAGIGTGAIFTPLLVDWLFSSYGWGTGFVVIGIASLVLVVSAAQFLRRGSGQRGQLPDGRVDVKQESLNLEAGEFSLREAIHTRQLWMLWAIFLYLGFCIFSIMAYIAILAVEVGITTTGALNILTVFGLLNIGCSIIIGLFADEIGNRHTLVASLVLMLVSLFLLYGAQPLGVTIPLFLFSTAPSFGCALLVLMSPIVAELFGLKSHGVLLGVIVTGLAIGAAIGSVLAGYIFDITGSSQIVFLICIILIVIAIGLAILLRPTNSRSELTHI